MTSTCLPPNCPPPEWPDKTIDEIVQLAFNGKVVDTLDHPVIQGLEGKI